MPRADFQQSDGFGTFLHLQVYVSHPSLTLKNQHVATSATCDLRIVAREQNAVCLAYPSNDLQ